MPPLRSLGKLMRRESQARPLARSRVFDPSEAPEARRTIFISSLVVALAFLALLSRLWYLQLLQGDHFRSLSENNRIRLVDVPPSRGLIFDAQGRLLAENRPAFALALVPEDVNDWDELGERLNKLVGISPEELRRARETASGQPPFKPVRLRAHLDREQLAVLETFRYELPGVKVMVEYRRAYLNAKETSHVIGYLGEINQQELAEAPKALYRIGDFVGRYGLEKSRERVLHGRRGARQVEVDAMGRELKLLSEEDPMPGHALILTLDLKMQQAAAAALGDEVGAVVALDPRNGQVYCMYSSPSFDQNHFITGMSSRLWDALANDPFHPLKNRAISGLYPPGSTYKIITAAAALAENVITPQATILCPGEIAFGRRTYKCWALKKGGHGNVALHRAIRESCDVYFYRVGLRLGVDRLAKYARAFGLGSLSGVPLASESLGLVPDSEWKKKRFGEPWQDGETLSLAIGQGFNLTTPIQLARMVAVVANRGRLVTPTLVKAVSPADGSEPVPEPAAVSTRVPVAAPGPGAGAPGAGGGGQRARGHRLGGPAAGHHRGRQDRLGPGGGAQARQALRQRGKPALEVPRPRLVCLLCPGRGPHHRPGGGGGARPAWRQRRRAGGPQGAGGLFWGARAPREARSPPWPPGQSRGSGGGRPGRRRRPGPEAGRRRGGAAQARGQEAGGGQAR